MNAAAPQETLDWISKDFADILPQNDVVQVLGDSADPEPLLAHMPHISFTFKAGAYARLKELIDVVNDF